jgi:hypothetical protein
MTPSCLNETLVIVVTPVVYAMGSGCFVEYEE